MENLEIKVRNEIQNVMNSIEYLRECIIQYINFNKGFLDGNKTLISQLIKQIEDNKKQIQYLQGNNNKYAVDIEQLRNNILNEIKETHNSAIDILEDYPIFREIFKINNVKITNATTNHFDQYLKKHQDDGVEYVK